MAQGIVDERAEIERDGLSAVQRVAKLAEIALRRLGSSGPNTPKFSSEIREKVAGIYPEIFDRIEESTFNAYLNKAPAENPRIVSLGTARGYYFDAPGITVAAQPAELAAGEAPQQQPGPEAPAVSPRTPREMKLYPHVESWLVANGYRAKIVAQGRALGPWGNPDVVGIHTIDILGYWHAETVSIEVKASNQNWARDIFEAISHRRYFDRCYFCYPVLANNRQISEEVKDYAELYEIGILLVELVPEEFEKLNAAQDLDPNLLSVTEVCPAPFRAVMQKYRKLAFQALGIGGLDTLFDWGRRPVD